MVVFEKGNIIIYIENIFLIIKKFFYIDYEIFLRELIFNVVDVISKWKMVVFVSDGFGEVFDF